MSRSRVTAIQQPDDTTCGPAALKLALEVLGKRKSLSALIKLCKTNANGTSTKNMCGAVTKLGLSALLVEYATLHHLQSALRYSPNQVRAVLVSYLYDLTANNQPHPDSGHWALVSSFQPSKSRIVLLDSITARKKSYKWSDFRKRWMDWDYKRIKTGTEGNQYKLIRKWQQQPMIVIALDTENLPHFTIETATLYNPTV